MKATLSYNQLEKNADKLRLLTEQNENAQTDVVLIAKKMGYDVTLTRFKEDIRGMVVCDDNERSIYADKNDDSSEKRFAIARGIGHILLHQNEEDRYFVDYRKKTTYDAKEYETCNFAMALLMPKNIAIPTWQRCQDIKLFANELGVSESAAITRLNQLNLLGD